LKYICSIGDASGFKVEIGHLRIPSTRNVALVGRTCNFGYDKEEEWCRIREQQKKLFEEAQFSKFEPKVRASSTHRG